MTELALPPSISSYSSGPGDPAGNMAMDEVLLGYTALTGTPVLRFYSWNKSAATFGYFQRYADIETLTVLRPLIRRPTGGGLVHHDRDWTYSLVFPAGHPWYELKAQQSYRLLHEWIQASFAECELPTDLCPSPRVEGPGQCFLGAEQHDLLWQNRKIAGAAQRRTRQGLLIQGSIQPPDGINRETWEEAFKVAGTRGWKLQWILLDATKDLLEQAQTLGTEKYATEAFNKKR
jgi:lipoate-protein ligase A